MRTTVITTLHALIAKLSRESRVVAGMNLTASVQDAVLGSALLDFASTSEDVKRVAEAINALTAYARLSLGEAETLMRSLLSDRSFYGTYCELAAYQWLHRYSVQFQAQPVMNGPDVLNPNGCTLDGRLTGDVDAYFDIKAMGFQEYIAERFRQRLEKRLPGLRVTIEGSMDVAVRDIEAHAFGQFDTVVGALVAGGHQQLPKLGWLVRAGPPRTVETTVQTSDPYRLAEQNRHYPFQDASQFTRHAPFILVFPFAAQFNHRLFVNFAQSTDILLRALARRGFLQMANDPTPVQQFDRKIAAGVLLRDASRLLSSFLFINLDTGQSWIYLNPRATHRLSRDHVERIFDFAPPPRLTIDDFAHDDY